MSTPPRLWLWAGLAGAFAVILPVAIGIAIMEPNLSDSLNIRAEREWDGTVWRAGEAAFRTTWLATLVGSIVGVPTALLFTGAMTLLERATPTAATLVAWVVGGILAGLPMIFVGMLLVGGATPLIILFDLLGVVGAGVAWFTRHGRAGRLA